MIASLMSDGGGALTSIPLASCLRLLSRGFILLQQAPPPEQPLPSLLSRIWFYVDHKFTIGNFSVSLASVVIGVLLLLIALLISRWMRRFLQRRMEERKSLDPGIQYTVLRLLHYVIITLGILFAFSTAFNTDLTSLAVVFTALSVGIGFGLQYIAGDIASGFILLFERPVKVNDFVTIQSDAKNELQGKVTSINLRTTNVTTNDRLTVIVPNSKLVTQVLVNWSYGDRRARISIPIGVSYGMDVDLVTKTLLRAVEGVEFVLDKPEPTVQFVQFGDFSLDFRLLVWTANPRRHPSIKSELNYRIWRLFKEAKIEIPFPRYDLNLRSGGVKIEAADAGLDVDEHDDHADPKK